MLTTRRLRILLFAALLCTVPTGMARAQDPTATIRQNQVGFWPAGPKMIAIVGTPSIPSIQFQIVRTTDGQVVYSGIMGDRLRWVSASDQEYARVADFSELTTEGTYVLRVDGLGDSYPFVIVPAVHEELTRSVLKAFYFARASTALAPAYAGAWARAAGHPDTAVLVHASAASAERPEGTAISSPHGWYDAGDYNKYVVNSGITTATLLMLYERFPAYFDALDLDIPESGNELPDLLDEVLWNLRWMMTMQDPNDGGVYHKLTTPNFEGFVMPANANQTRYVVQKSSAATLNFAAVAAIGARVFDDFPQTQSLADSLLEASAKAWVWAHYQQSDLIYNQGALNAEYDPDINTGTYGDGDLYDEYRWASTELYITTRADSLLFMYPPIPASRPSVPDWRHTTSLGLWSLALHREAIGSVVDTTGLRERLLEAADALVGTESAYGIVFGNSQNDFVWGSNSVAANQANMLLVAYEWTRNPEYLEGAVSNLDYLLGRNAVGYSFVTGYGARPPMHPHHRPSEADGVADPVPGMLVGGVNPGREDGCMYPYPANQPARSYVDDVCSYASNEVAINWQASISFLAGALEAIMSPNGLPGATDVDRSDAIPPRGFDVDAWPNPSTGSATVAVSLARDATVSASVYDLLGRRVASVIENEHLAAGTHRRGVDAGRLSAGVYLVRIEADGAVASRPWIVVR